MTPDQAIRAREHISPNWIHRLRAGLCHKYELTIRMLQGDQVARQVLGIGSRKVQLRPNLRMLIRLMGYLDAPQVVRLIVEGTKIHGAFDAPRRQGYGHSYEEFVNRLPEHARPAPAHHTFQGTRGTSGPYGFYGLFRIERLDGHLVWWIHVAGATRFRKLGRYLLNHFECPREYKGWETCQKSITT